MMIGGSFNGPGTASRRRRSGKPAGIFVDNKRNEMYVADGYLNRRVIVFNPTSGAFLRLWGAYGNPPVDLPAGQPPDPNAPISTTRSTA